MNGLSLLVALATLGVDVGWEPTSSGKPAYTIRIEPIVIDQLGEGSAIESVVDKIDRGIRKFRVAVGPKNVQTERAATATSTANEVDYGWRPNETGGIDYYVQISRERLETLARGIPLECEVHPDVPGIEKIYVFVGDTKLPRELPPGARNAAPPRDISASGNSHGNVAPVSGTETNLGAHRYGDAGYGAQPPQNNVTNSSAYGPQTYGPNPSTGYRDQASSPAGRYGQYGDNTLPVPSLENSRPPDYGRNQYAPQQEPYGRQQQQQQAQQPYAPPLQTVALPSQPPYNPQQGQTQPFGNPSPTYPTGIATNPGSDALAASLAFTQAQLEKAQLEKAQLEKERLANANTPPEPKVTVVEAKSSKPLILTTLALFASIGANAYLGWLAWSFFWRFRDAASDLSRARSTSFPASSLVGH